MTQEELEKKLDDIICTHMDIKPNTDMYLGLTNFIGYEVESQHEKNFIVLNKSFKLKNIRFEFKKAISFVTENALAIGMTYDSMDVYKGILLVLIDTINLCTKMMINLNEDMVATVIYLHKKNAYKSGVNKEQLKKNVKLKRDIDEVLNNLVKCKSIAVKDDIVCLKERVIIRNKKEKSTRLFKGKKGNKT